MTIEHRIIWDVIDIVNKELGLLQNLKEKKNPKAQRGNEPP